MAMGSGLRFDSARALFAACPEASADMRALPTDQPSIAFCRSLLASATPEEAVTFCAHLLPQEALIWWGHECLVNLSKFLDDADLEVLSALRAWVTEPYEYRHQTIIAEASATVQRTPATWIAIAASWRISSPEGSRQAAIYAVRAVNAGILAALARVALADRLSVLTGLVEMGIEVAETEALRTAETI